jgi:hypothetical protein
MTYMNFGSVRQLFYDRAFQVFILFCFCLGSCFLTEFSAWHGILAKLTVLKSKQLSARSYQEYFKDDIRDIRALTKQLNDADVAQILSALEEKANVSGALLQHVSPKELVVKGPFGLIPIELDFSVPQAKLKDFMLKLEELPLVFIKKAEVFPIDKGEDSVKGHVTIEKVILKLGRQQVDKNVLGKNDLARLKQFIDERKTSKQLSQPAKDLFRRPVETVTRNIQASSEDTQNLLKDLNLAGIVDDGVVKAVIEDKKAGKTYFLKIGDVISGLKVLKIADQEVVLEGNGQNYSLML